MRKHPIQNVHIDEKGQLRFVQNKIVRDLVDRVGLNWICSNYNLEVPDDDYDQLMQLIGYSLSGFQELGELVKGSTITAAKLKKPIEIK